MADQIEIGDAVIPTAKPEHDVMTVYDLTDSYRTARCNWVVGTRMFKADYAVSALTKLQRQCNAKRGR